MSKELFVSSTPHETKVAIVEEDQLAEIYFERENEYTLAGSIYKGKVTRVLPGMQSAFVEIGLERDAFLYVTDFVEPQDEDGEIETIPHGEQQQAAEEPAGDLPGESRRGRRGRGRGGRQQQQPPASAESSTPAESETNEGVTGWGEATLEGKASAAMACVMDLKDLIIGNDPMQVEHLYQLMYIGSFYRGGPVLGSAISGIDQALWDIRGKVMNMPVYEMLGGPVDPRGVRGYYHASAWSLAEAHRVR